MAEEVHVGRGSRKSKLPRWQFVLGLVVAVVLALAAGVFVRWIIDRDQMSEEPPKPLSAELQEIQTLSLDGKQEEADAKIQEGLDNPSTSPGTKFILYSQQGANYYEKAEYQKALEAYTKASEINDTSSIAQSIATTWEKIGDKQQAVKYLRHAIEIMPNDNPVREDEIQMLEMQIKMLESGT